MRLSVKPIVSWCNVNTYTFGNQWTIRAGDPNTLYFQVIDLDQSGSRYMVGVGAPNQPYSINVTFPSIDNTKVLTIAAVQDPNDSSIWKVSIPANQQPAGGNVQFQIIEGSSTRSFSVTNLIGVEYLNSGSC